MKTSRASVLFLVSVLLTTQAVVAADALLVRSAKSGAWSDAKTWEGGKLPPAGAKVLVRPGHDVLYDMNSSQPVRSLHIGGTLRFATDRDTRLDVGLIKVQAGEDVNEEGFDCEAHLATPAPDAPRATLLVGTAEQPVEAKHTALIRLT
ncbi:MAG TPA: G8 domain-containing protein, partial [Verrucomicrobiae bacterium]